MGDISRHRDIFLNTRDAIPTDLLGRCKIKTDDLTFLELGNYLTDVSQFRDPVTYIFAKQRIWREKVLPEAAEKLVLLRALTTLATLAGAAALANANKTGYEILTVASLPAQDILFRSLPEAFADLFDLDDWIDAMFGKPVDKLGPGGKRKPEEYGLVGQFFEHFIEGITHLVFAKEISQPVPGNWGKVTRVPEKDLTAVYKQSYTQYYPHEHTDQPPYVWDASKRPQHPDYQSSTQRSLSNKGGIMNIVDGHYLRYLAEELSRLEDEFPRLKDTDVDKRRDWLVRMGKVLHGIEDWYFHSNVVELIHLSGYRSKHRDEPNDEAFLQRFVNEELKHEPVFLTARNTQVQRELKRKFYRRLRFPVYDEPRGKADSTGTPNKKKSTLSLDHAYPAFPSGQDTAHTLLGALQNLERKVKGGAETTTSKRHPWVPCVIQKFFDAGPHWKKVADERAKARGLGLDRASLDQLLSSPPAIIEHKVEGFVGDVLREWLPLVITLLSESERQRLVADIDPLHWPPQNGTPKTTQPGDGERDDQKKRHRAALEQRTDAQGHHENNYTRAVRYMRECGFLNGPGQLALVAAFDVDEKSERMSNRAPGAGGFLIEYSVELQKTLDEAEAVTERLNKAESATFAPPTDNGSFNETIGSHSLMSKDTLTSQPFFDDANVLASLASQTVFHIMLDEVSAPATEKLDWHRILRHLIRYPDDPAGWERQALAFFKDPRNGRFPKFADVPKLADLKSARLAAAVSAQLIKGQKAAELERRYTKLETDLVKYRYPE